MSEHNYAGMLFKHNIENHPDVFIINPEKLEKAIAQTIKTTQAIHAKNDEAKGHLPEQRKEYNRLLNDHFNLKQWVRSCEIRVNESAGQIHNLEQRLTSLLIEKKAIESPKGQRTIENAIVRLEGEIAEEKSNYNSLRTENNRAVKQLKSFDVARLEELKTELDTPKIMTK
jgi:hypothetical protein